MKTTYRILAFALAAIACGAVVVSCQKEEEPSPYTVEVTVAYGSGTAAATPASARPGETVTLTATPAEGYTFAGWTVTGGAVELSGEYDNPATFTMPAAKVEVSAGFDAVRSTEGALWHEGVEAWVIPQNDPYELENVQAAADNLAARGTTRAETVAATHLALRIFPRTEDEQWALEKTQDVMLSYIPFDWLALTDEEAAKLEQEQGTRADGDRPLFPDASPYVVTDDEIAQTVDEGVETSVSQEMPIVYAVWPVGKALPGELDYEVDYEVWLPSAAGQTRGTVMDAETARAVEREAIRLALGDAAASRVATRAGGAATRAGITLSGEFMVWEALKTVQGPVPNVKVKFHLGSNIVETVSDESGRFSVTADAIPSAASWDIVYQTPEWKLTRPTSTVPKFFVQGDVYQSNYWSADRTHIRPSVQPFDAAIHKALGYYYYTDHNLSRWTVPDGIRIIAHNSASGAYNGMFTYSSSGLCYITVYHNNTSTLNYLMGTVFHELGHFVHFRERGGYAGMKAADRFIQESFASYAGWYLTEKYYRELGYEKTSPAQDISGGQGRQTSWRSTTAGEYGYYSPLFVDLVDDYNQRTAGDTYNDDRVKGAHYSIIMRIVKESADWTSCRNILNGSADLTGQEGWNDFLAPYETWYSNQ